MLTLTRQVFQARLRVASHDGIPVKRHNIPSQSYTAQNKSNLAAKTSSALFSILQPHYHAKTLSAVSKQSVFANSMVRAYTNDASSSGSSEDLATVNWVLKNGDVKPITEKIGMNLLEIAHKHGIDLEGACEASLACSTCHIIVEDPDVFEMTGEISDEENDMLDLAFGLTQTSRLGCQVKLSKELDGIYVRLPSATRNMMVDGHVPKPH